MRPTVGPSPRFEELEKASGFVDVASIIEENAFRTAYYEAKQAHFDEKNRTTRVDEAVCGSPTSSNVIKTTRRVASDVPYEDYSVRSESDDTVHRLARYRCCVNRLAATYRACRNDKDHFYFDHRASTVPEHRFAFAHGGWEPIDFDDRDCFECPPTAREALLCPNSRTGRP
jgi:hypothetical protein